jgi:hypothetical protein
MMCNEAKFLRPFLNVAPGPETGCRRWRALSAGSPFPYLKLPQLRRRIAPPSKAALIDVTSHLRAAETLGATIEPE